MDEKAELPHFPHDNVQRRAYELYEQRGRKDGYALEDWLQAEHDVRGTSMAQPADLQAAPNELQAQPNELQAAVPDTLQAAPDVEPLKDVPPTAEAPQAPKRRRAPARPRQTPRKGGTQPGL
jgi:hypothetical protein